LYLSGFTHAEAETNYPPIDDANVTWQRVRTNVFSPGLRCDPNGAQPLFGGGILPRPASND
jgi:hypothetical protein